MRELLYAGKLVKQGSTRNAVYLIPKSSPSKDLPGFSARSFLFNVKGLEEDRVFNQISETLRLKAILSIKAYGILSYAFTEMLNNAIDHSKAVKVACHFSVTKGNIQFSVIDRGIGVYESIRKRFRFRDYYEAMEHLLKGKVTTDPKRHTGQGIFFTSRVADRFTLDSGHLRLIAGSQSDTTILRIKEVKGTTVGFVLKVKSRKDLKALFDKYTNDALEFDKTEIYVKLIKTEGSYVSRSEAKRLLLGLDKFKRVILDFKEVKTVGQAFADEVFRVFCTNQPSIELKPVNMNKETAFMVKRALA